MKLRDWIWIIAIALGAKLLFAVALRAPRSIPAADGARTQHTATAEPGPVARAPSAPTAGFERIELSRAISLDIPLQWEPMPEELTTAIRTSADAMLANEGISGGTSDARLLLAYTSRPTSTYASVRVKEITPVEVAPAELLAASDDEVASVAPALVETLSGPMAKNGQTLLPGATSTREVVSGFPALVLRYRRQGNDGVVNVEQIKIMTPTREVVVTLSYRESERLLWAAVIENIRRSIMVHAET